LEAEARQVTRSLQTIEFAFRAALSIRDKEALLKAIENMPTAEKLRAILNEIDEKAATQEQCEATLKNYGMKLPPIF